MTDTYILTKRRIDRQAEDLRHPPVFQRCHSGVTGRARALDMERTLVKFSIVSKYGGSRTMYLANQMDQCTDEAAYYCGLPRTCMIWRARLLGKAKAAVIVRWISVGMKRDMVTSQDNRMMEYVNYMVVFTMKLATDSENLVGVCYKWGVRVRSKKLTGRACALAYRRYGKVRKLGLAIWKGADVQ